MDDTACAKHFKSANVVGAFINDGNVRTAKPRSREAAKRRSNALEKGYWPIARKKCNGFDFKSPASPLRVFAARVFQMFPVLQS